MEMESFKNFWKLAHQDPTTGIQIRKVLQFFDEVSLKDKSKMWSQKFLPHFRWLEKKELPNPARGITCGVEYTSMAINPFVYLPWLRTKLEEEFGVKFIKCNLDGLSDIDKHVNGSHIAVINCTGLGASKLIDVKDTKVYAVRGQTMWAKAEAYDGPMMLRHGQEYTYVIPRLFSGGVILGGVSQPLNSSHLVDSNVNEDILLRVEAMCPKIVQDARQHASREQPNIDDFHGIKVLRNIVGFRPTREGGVQVELSWTDNQLPVIHVNGLGGAGYIYSGGIASRVEKLLTGISSRL